MKIENTTFHNVAANLVLYETDEKLRSNLKTWGREITRVPRSRNNALRQTYNYRCEDFVPLVKRIIKGSSRSESKSLLEASPG